MANSCCPACNADIALFEHFCGACGTELPAVAEDERQASSADSAPPPSAPPRRTVGRAPLWGGVLLSAVGLAVLVVSSLLARPAESVIDAAGSRSSDPAASVTPDEDGSGASDERSEDEENGGAQASRSENTQSGGGLVPGGATEIDRAEDFPYARKRVGCSDHVYLSDAFKALGQEIDRSLRDVTKVSVAEENDFGRRTISSLESDLGGTLVSSGRTVDYLKSVAKPLLGKVKRKSVDYKFYVLRGLSLENAFALPGGHIVVTQPLLDGWIKNEAQLATVLGHEIAHVDLRHPVAVLQYLKTLGLSGDDMVGRALVHFAQTPYSSNLEESSDELGAGFAHASGYSVFQAVALWEERDKKGSRRSGGAGSPGGLLGEIMEGVVSELSHVVSSHPDPARRACFLRQLAYDLYRDEPMSRAYVGRTNWVRKQAFPSSVF